MSDKVKFGFENAHESPGYLLWQVTMLWQRKIKQELDKLNITHTQFVLMSVVAWLSSDKEIVTQVDVADNCKVDRMMTSKVLRTLETKGLVMRKAHPTDTRANTVSLTKEGSSTLQKAIIQVEAVDSFFFGSDDKIIEQLSLLIDNNK